MLIAIGQEHYCKVLEVGYICFYPYPSKSLQHHLVLHYHTDEILSKNQPETVAIQSKICILWTRLFEDITQLPVICKERTMFGSSFCWLAFCFQYGWCLYDCVAVPQNNFMSCLISFYETYVNIVLLEDTKKTYFLITYHKNPVCWLYKYLR